VQPRTNKKWLRKFGQLTDKIIYPTMLAIVEFLSSNFENIYTSSIYEINSNRVIGNYAKDKYLRFLSRKSSA